MPIVVNLDVMMAKRKMSLNELSARVDITLANLSILKNNHAKAVRFTRLSARRWTVSRATCWNTCRSQQNTRRGGLWLSVFCYIQKNIIEIR